ncbi:MAG: hypothetical protein RRY64_01850, partial [Oscillospiraceae bacterium]
PPAHLAAGISALRTPFDKKRASYVRFYAGVDGRQLINYYLCVDSGRVGINGAAAAIQAVYLAL